MRRSVDRPGSAGGPPADVCANVRHSEIVHKKHDAEGDITEHRRSTKDELGTLRFHGTGLSMPGNSAVSALRTMRTETFKLLLAVPLNTPRVGVQS
jgi:hypothetical protein